LKVEGGGGGLEILRGERLRGGEEGRGGDRDSERGGVERGLVGSREEKFSRDTGVGVGVGEFVVLDGGIKDGDRNEGMPVGVEESGITGKKMTRTITPTANTNTPQPPIQVQVSTENSKATITRGPTQETSIPSQSPRSDLSSESTTATKTILETPLTCHSKSIHTTLQGTILITPSHHSRSSISYSSNSTSESTDSRISRIPFKENGEFTNFEGNEKSINFERNGKFIHYKDNDHGLMDIKSRNSTDSLTRVDESRIEWSRRMVRYQKEEVRCLGLEIISLNSNSCQKSILPLPGGSTSQASQSETSLISRNTPAKVSNSPTPSPETKPPIPHMNEKLPHVEEKSAKERRTQGRRLHKSAKLSKERFEMWLNGLIPGSPAESRVPVIESQGEGEMSETCIPGNEVGGVVLEKGPGERANGLGGLQGTGEKENGIVDNGEGVTEERGRDEIKTDDRDERVGCEMMNGTKFEGRKMRDWGVQTEVSGCLIIF
jgi:hypothetical protein